MEAVKFAMPLKIHGSCSGSSRLSYYHGMVISVTQSSKIEFPDWLGVIGTTHRRGTCFSQN
jgi:hypothetical protein